MAADPEVDRTLEHIRAATRRMCDELAALSPAAWDGLSSCPPWSIRQLVAHVIISGESFRGSVERGVAGQTEPAAPEAGREGRIAELAAAAPAELVARLERATADIEALYQGLSAADLEAICYHRRGNRSARWYIQHRLAEVAFHGWDLQRSLGCDAVLAEGVGEHLLPMLLESNAPRIYPLGPRGEGRVRLVVEGAPAASWLLTAGPERLEVERGGGEADATITAPAEVLALLVYGRVDLADQERRGRAQIAGDRSLVERIRTIFPGP